MSATDVARSLEVPKPGTFFVGVCPVAMEKRGPSASFASLTSLGMTELIQMRLPCARSEDSHPFLGEARHMAGEARMRWRGLLIGACHQKEADHALQLAVSSRAKRGIFIYADEGSSLRLG